jgi:hypothetical protein
MAWASACGKACGATSTSRRKPMVFIARAAAPMFPGWEVPTSTMRIGSSMMGAASWLVGETPGFC